MSRFSLAFALLATTLAAGACAAGNSTPTDASSTRADAPAVLSVLPAAGTIGADPTRPIALTFSMPMMTGMEMLVIVHEGTVTGPQVAGTTAWSADRTILTFTPSAQLKAKTAYVLHLSPSLRGANGNTMTMAGGLAIGGKTVTAGMMGTAASGMMNGQGVNGMMGAGWMAADGTFGMIFLFTTA